MDKKNLSIGFDDIKNEIIRLQIVFRNNKGCIDINIYKLFSGTVEDSEKLNLYWIASTVEHT